MSTLRNDIELLTLLTNKAFPTAHATPITVSEVIAYPSWQHDTLAYTSVWGDGETLPLMLRRYRSPLTFWQTHDPKKADRVWAVLRRLRLDSFPSPRPLAHGKFGESTYLIWHTAPGQPLSTLAAIADLKAMIPRFAQTLVSLHTLNHSGLNNEPLYQATVAGTLVRMLLWSREAGNPLLKTMIARLKPPIERLVSWPHKLIHGNPNLSNVLVYEGEITALINWENSAIGDPRWDVMTAAYGLRAAGPELADQLVNWYETFTSRVIDQRSFWYALISVRQWALKLWLHHAVQTKKVSSECAAWTYDVEAAYQKAENDLAEAGL